MVEQTKNQIKYEWGLDGPKGMVVMLYPIKGVDSQDSIKEAQKQLREDLDVSTIEVFWTSKEDNAKLEVQPLPEREKEPEIIEG